jgi:hypothetical protein
VTIRNEAVGKYIVYREALEIRYPDRVLYLALPTDVYKDFGSEPLVKNTFTKYDFKIILYEPKNEIITSWIK